MQRDAAMRQASKCSIADAIALIWVALVAAALCAAPRLVLPDLVRDASAMPLPPDYTEPQSWAALPQHADGADVVPAWCGTDGQSAAHLDAFFVHPTSYLIGSRDNAPLDDPISNLIVWSFLIEMANSLNHVARIYAPRYRSASQGVQDGGDGLFNWRPTRETQAADAAMHLAYSDVERAFSHFIDAWNDDRPILLMGHSQGTLHLKRLLQRLPEFRPNDHAAILDRVVVAYLVGNTVEEHEVPLAVCEHPTQTRCVVSWNTVLEGGSYGAHWVGKVQGNHSRPLCVNPLTWRRDSIPADRSLALGAVPVTGHLLLHALPTNLISARCGEDGVLYVSHVPSDQPLLQPGVIGSTGGGMHPLDVQLVWRNVRTNAAQRVGAYLNSTLLEEPCPRCIANVACIAGLTRHGLLAATGLYALAVLLSFGCILPGFCCVVRCRDGAWPNAARAIGFSCWMPCYVYRARRGDSLSVSGLRRRPWSGVDGKEDDVVVPLSHPLQGVHKGTPGLTTVQRVRRRPRMPSLESFVSL